MSFKDTWQSLPGWSKGIIGTVVIGGTAFTAYTIYNNAKKRKELAASNQAAAYASQELNTLAAMGVVPSYSTVEFETWSQDLQQAMNSCKSDMGTITNVFNNMKNKADVLMLIYIFGIRYYTPCASSHPISYIVNIFNDQAYGGGFPTWVSYNLSSSQIGQINDILKNKNIAYSF